MRFNPRKILGKIPQKYWYFSVFLLGILAVYLFNYGLHATSTNSFCESCHVHPHSTTTWRQGAHYNTESGVIIDCVDCHLPPGGITYLTEKARTGIRDIYGKLFKDVSKINWERRSKREFAVHYVYKASCVNCHQNLFPAGLNKEGEDAHLYYEQKPDELRCINCHLETGHYHEEPPESIGFGAQKPAEPTEIYMEPTRVDSFVNYTEKIPGSSVAFDMIAIPGDTFTMGSPVDESYRGSDEDPQRQVKVSKFWIGKTEVTWDEYEAFYAQTSGEGRSEDQFASVAASAALPDDIESITGPTPAYGNPSQGWGRGKRPAITMTYYAATQYCKWLSMVTGKTYRLPTEAEWEYAARANTEGPYFFEGSPKDYTRERFLNRIFGVDTTTINTYVIYTENSEGMTHPPSVVQPNPFGLLHTLGNVWEFCSDWYAPNAYTQYPAGEVIVDPTGPSDGEEHVIRGGSYKTDAIEVRVANRAHTRHDAWMVTDPQMPKSLWWYSDNAEVGFRVVCEYEGDD